MITIVRAILAIMWAPHLGAIMFNYSSQNGDLRIQNTLTIPRSIQQLEHRVRNKTKLVSGKLVTQPVYETTAEMLQMVSHLASLKGAH